jgi:ribosomal protein S18 acetylase RimI-like enzyme
MLLYTKPEEKIMNVEIRWMERADIQECAEIEQVNTSKALTAWTEDDFKNELSRDKDTAGQVLEVGGKVVGFFVYVLQTKQIILLHMAVAKSMQRKGLGSIMLNKLKRKLRHGRRERIIVPVRETLLGAQLFMKANGFSAINVLRNDFLDTGEDSYIFEYRSPQVLTEPEVAISRENT